MSNNNITRRNFVKASALAAAGAALAWTPTYTVYAGNPTKEKTTGILNYNEQMEYRRGGKTNLMFSAVCLGGHWKRVDAVLPSAFQVKGGWNTVNLENTSFYKNRYDVVTRCIERGINFVDACTMGEGIAYSHALKGRRDKMYLGFSNYVREPQTLLPKTSKEEMEVGRLLTILKTELDDSLKQMGTDYVDIWRISCGAVSSHFTESNMDEICEALAWAKKEGRARFTGVASHDRVHLKKWIQRNPNELEVVLTPYTAKSQMTDGKIGKVEEGQPSSNTIVDKNVSWEDSLWHALQKNNIAWFGIKPFASNALFKGDSSLNSPHKEEDDKLARLIIRSILNNPAITAPIPGMISPEQVDNVALAVRQRRELDAKEQASLDAGLNRAFANLPPHYQWLRDWGYV
ncbi:MAG: aldo/keto reductase [Kiritimatiellae bacterium]|nr:aldo/keto reductase [Kiritimatiellia bacterium]MDD5523274.1 aldo/keto reductase [Kiritimatiellia bacterium]